MEKTIIDFTDWKRKSVFEHFIKEVKCVISLTADLDITNLLSFCQSHELKFYPVMLHLVAKAINRREEFRLGYDETGRVVCWDVVMPSHIVFHEEDEQFTRLVTTYSDCLATFYAQVLADMQSQQDKRGLEVQYDYPNTFDVSCLPWLHFKSFDLHVSDGGTYLAPIVTWGKYIKTGGRYVVPLNIMIHHAAADGFHAARFFADLEKLNKNL